MSLPASTNLQHRITAGPEADRLARAVYASLLGDLGVLTEDDWQRATDCPGWSVRTMVAHLVGAAQGHASVTVFTRQYVWGLRHRKSYDGSSLDAMNERQIQVLQERSPHELVELLRALAPRAVAGRARLARYLGRVPISLDQAGSWYQGMPTRTTMAELSSVVLTRDVWVHRLDIARAVGAVPSMDAYVDRRMTGDIVSDWANRHGQPFDLTLAGPSGGTFRVGDGGQALTLDAVDFVRMMAGRRPDAAVPDSPLWASKALF